MLPKPPSILDRAGPLEFDHSGFRPNVLSTGDDGTRQVSHEESKSCGAVGDCMASFRIWAEVRARAPGTAPRAGRPQPAIRPPTKSPAKADFIIFARTKQTRVTFRPIGHNACMMAASPASNFCAGTNSHLCRTHASPRRHFGARTSVDTAKSWPPAPIGA